MVFPPGGDLLEPPQAEQRVVGHGLDPVPLQVDVREVLHPPEGPGDPPEVVLEAEQLPQRRLLDEDPVGDVEQVTVGQVQTHQLLQAREGSSVEVADVLVMSHLQLHQVGEALQDERLEELNMNSSWIHYLTAEETKTHSDVWTKSKHLKEHFSLFLMFNKPRIE